MFDAKPLVEKPGIWDRFCGGLIEGIWRASPKGNPAPSAENQGVQIPDALLPTLRAALARLVPTDQDPGALELGAEAFIQERVAENPDVQATYERGLGALRDRGFLSLPSDEQDELLRDFETSHPDFLSVIAAHAVEAVYTQPVGWKMVGFEVTL